MLLATLSTFAVSCQKENVAEAPSTITEIGAARTIFYTINGVRYRINLIGNHEWNEFITNMMMLAEQGYSIKFSNGKTPIQDVAPKDIQKLTTKSQDEAIAWVKKKADEGYSVDVQYCNGVYTCIAIR